MANVLHRITKRYEVSVNTPDFPVSIWIINPDVSAFRAVLSKYWNINGDIVTEMSAAEKTVVDTDEVLLEATTQRSFEKGRFLNERGLSALVDVFIEEFNRLRQQHGLNPRTRAQLKTAIETRIDEI